MTNFTDIIILGVQGSGKGTQGDLILEHFPYIRFEAGKECRQIANLDTELGKKVKSIIEKGDLVSDEVMINILYAFIENKDITNQAILYDGIPRHLGQYEMFIEYLNKYKRNFNVIIIDLDKDKALNRILHRQICEDCKTPYSDEYAKGFCSKCSGKLIRRQDDIDPAVVNRRIKNYYNQTGKVIDKFKSDFPDKIFFINGDDTIENIFEAIKKII